MTGFTNAYNAHGWYVLNGLWNLGDATERSAIRTVFDPNDVTAGVVFNWNLPHSTSAPIIRGYPEVQFGVNPHGSYAGNPTDNYRVFPIRVSDIVSLTADFDVSYSGNLAGFNVAYDIWFTNAPNGNASAISNEIMVWLHEGDFAPFGDVIGTYTHDGLTATIYHAGTYTAFVFDGDVTKGVLDIADLIGTLRDMGIIDESEYLASVELGAEVVSGIGSLTVNNLDLEVVTRDENGTIVIENVTGAGTTVREVVPVDEPNVDTPSIPKEDGPPTLPDDDDEEAPSGSTSPTPEHSVTKGAPVNGGCVMEVIKQDTSFAGFEAFAGASTPSYGHLDAMVELKDIGGEVLFAGYAVAADDAPGFSGDAVLAFGSHDLGASDFFLI
ncbi:MAG: hypothetical protein EOP58_01280 [Sphingomonadales bacterium]|nr:MAG: hypothetical protein EOP58_01280 [Sphingomonadales bacterium]